MLFGIATGMVQRANQLSRASAAQAREDELLKKEQERQMGLSIMKGVIEGTVRPETYQSFLDNPEMPSAELASALSTDREYFDNAVTAKELKQKGYDFLQNLVDKGIVPAEELAKSQEEDWDFTQYWDTGGKYATIFKNEEEYEKIKQAKIDLFKDDDIRKAYTGPDPSLVIEDSRFEVGDILDMSLHFNKEDSVIRYGNFTHRKPVNYDKNINSGDLFVAGKEFFMTIEGILSDPEKSEEFKSELQNNPKALAQFNSDLERNTDYYVNGYQSKNTNPATGSITGYVPPSEDFPSVFKFQNSVSPNQKITDTSDSVQKENLAIEGTIKNPKNSVVFKFISPEGTQSRDVLEFDEDKFQTLTRIALGLGMGDAQELVDRFQDVSRADNAEDAYGILFAAIDLEIQGATAFNRTSGVNNEKAAQIGSYLLTKFGQDRIMMAQAMQPLMRIDEDNGIRSKRMKYTMQPAATYFKKYLDIDVSQLQLQYDETQETVRLLNELMNRISKESSAVGFTANLKQVFSGIFSESGQLSQLLGQNTDNVSSQQVLTRAKDLGFISTDVIQDLSEIESLKLTLAAKMARAIDPSGRLSNQDFEVQLQRLGVSGLFSSTDQAKAKLNIVIQDFVDRSQRLTNLYNISKASKFGAREARLLKADSAISQSLDAYRVQQAYYTETNLPDDSSESESSLTYNEEFGLYQDKQGNFFEDKQGKNPKDSTEVMQNFFEAGV